MNDDAHHLIIYSVDGGVTVLMLCSTDMTAQLCFLHLPVRADAPVLT